MLEQLSAETRNRLAVAHVEHFVQLCELGLRGNTSVNLIECGQYLALWRDTLAATQAGIEPERWDPRWVSEMIDAVWSGDYDHLYTEEERIKIAAANARAEDADDRPS